MQYTARYRSPMGEILLAADGTGLTGLWFEGAKYYAGGLDPEHEERELPVFGDVRKWLDIYFTGKEPDFTPPVHMTGSPFRLGVWELLRQIPYGETVTYGELAQAVAGQRGLARMSAQAVGGAVGHNPISLIVSPVPAAGTAAEHPRQQKGTNRRQVSVPPQHLLFPVNHIAPHNRNFPRMRVFL